MRERKLDHVIFRCRSIYRELKKIEKETDIPADIIFILVSNDTLRYKLQDIIDLDQSDYPGTLDTIKHQIIENILTR